MIDIKPLYSKAKATRSQADLDAYIEAVTKLVNEDPVGYVSQLEYIIKNSTSLESVHTFINKYGLSIPLCERMSEGLNTAIETCKEKSLDSSVFESVANELHTFKEANRACFDMFDYYATEDVDSYIDTYYGSNKKGTQNANLIAGMYQKFGEMAIPDMIIRGEATGNLDTVMEYVESLVPERDDVYTEGVSRSGKIKQSLTDITGKKPTGSEKRRWLKAAREKFEQFKAENSDAIKDLIDTKYPGAFPKKSSAIFDLGRRSDDTSEYSDYLIIIDNLYPIIGRVNKKKPDEVIKELNKLDDLVKFSYRPQGKVIPIFIDVPQTQTHVIWMAKSTDSTTSEKPSNNADKQGETSIDIANDQPLEFITIMDAKKFIQSLGDTEANDKQEMKETVSSEPLLADWLYEITQDQRFYENGNMMLVEDCVSNNHELLRESVINGSEDVYYEYSANDVDAIKNVISMKEFELSGMENVNEMLECQNEIYDLYVELANSIDEDTADEILPMLPSNGPIEEGPTWVVNTRDKKTGGAPNYIKRNHDMARWGEDDDPPKPSEDEPSIDDYKRPSAEPEPAVDDEPNTDAPIEDEEPTPNQQAVQNYYYYTYNNSLNKNSRSFNRDHSTHDDHSYHDDHSKHTDDHSTGKMINSNNVTGSPDYGNESTAPWRLNIMPTMITEDVATQQQPIDDNRDPNDPERPKSDHPILDTAMDIEQRAASKKAERQRVRQKVKATTRAVAKPITKTKDWIINTVNNWKDNDETKIKEKLADPHSRNNLFSAIKAAIGGGMLLKAGLLLNPIVLFLGATRFIGKNKQERRLRNEMISELKTEMQVVDEKIKDADRNGDDKAKYQLMRFKNELNKKLIRVGAGATYAGKKGWGELI